MPAPTPASRRSSPARSSAATLSAGGLASNIGAASNVSTNIVLSGGVLSYTGASTSTDRGMTVTVATGGGIDVPTAGTNLTIAGAVVSTNFSVLTKTGSGALTLAGGADNTFLGMTINAGNVTLAKASTSTLHALAGTVTINSGTSLILSGTGGDQLYSQANVVVNDGGILDMGGTSESFDKLTGTGTVTNTVNGISIVSVGENNGTFSFAGVLQDGGTGAILGFTKKGQGTVTLGGTAPNTYSGTTTLVNVGVTAFDPLILNKPAGIAAVSSSITMGSSGSGYAVLQLAAPEQIPDNAVITMAATSGNWCYIKLMGNSETVAGITDTAAAGVIENMESEAVNTNAVLTITATVPRSYSSYLRNRGGGSGTGTLGITLNGTSVQTLSGASITYTGPTTVAAGAGLKLADTTAFNSAIANDGTVEFNAVAGFTLGTPVPLSGAGTWNKTGTGTLQFNGTQAIATTGLFDVKAGKLQNNNNAVNWSGNLGTMFVASGATLDLFADPIYVDQLTGTGTVTNTFGNLTGFSGLTASTEKLVVGTNGGSSTFAGLITDSGNAAGNANGGRLELDKVGTGTFTLAGANTYKGNTYVTAGSIVLANSLAVQNSSVNLVGGSIAFDSSVATHAFTLASLVGSSTTNVVLQDNASPTPNPVTLALGGSSATYAGFFTGPGGINKVGAGTLTINNASNNFAGGVTITSGILNFTSGSLDSSSGITFAGGGTLQWATGNIQDVTLGQANRLNFGTASGILDTNGNNVALQGNLTGTTGGFTKAGVGNLVLSGVDTYNGATTVSAGMLEILTPTALYNDVAASWVPSLISVNSGATLGATIGGVSDFAAADIQTLLTNLSTVNSNGLKAGSTFAFDASRAPAPTTYAGVITDTTGTGSGALNIAKIGAGTLVLTGLSTYTGVTSALGGTLSAGVLANGGQPSNIGAAATASANIVLNGGALSYTGASTSIDRGMTVNATNGGGIDVPTAATNLTVAGAVVSTATSSQLIKTGSGALTLAGAADNAFLGLNVAGGNVILAKTSTTAVHAIGGIVNVNSGGSLILSGTGGDQIFTQSNVTVNAGGILDLAGTSEGFNGLSGAGTVTNSIVGTSILTVGEANANTTFSGVLTDGTAAGTAVGAILGFTKKGAGMQTLAGALANTYTGPTLIRSSGSTGFFPLVLAKTPGVAAVSSQITIGTVPSGGTGYADPATRRRRSDPRLRRHHLRRFAKQLRLLRIARQQRDHRRTFRFDRCRRRRGHGRRRPSTRTRS